MRTIGVVVNPIAGMGGRVGLKGTDGQVAEARARGAEPRAPERAVSALRALGERDADVRVLTYGGSMGADEARAAGFEPTIVGDPAGEETTAADTREAVRAFVERGVDLVLFVGGDGTAVDVAEALDELDAEIPILGVPAGVKVYSSVFAVQPDVAGRIAADFEDVEIREVSDIDEEAYREGEVRAEPRAVASVPIAEDLQTAKSVVGGSVETLAAGVATDVEPGVTYVLGPGGTVGAVKRELGFDGSPLGVDVYRDGEVLLRDATEAEILDALGEQNVIVVSPIGGQGFVLGRGNDQLSPSVVRQCDLEIIASPRKLEETGVLRVDTGDPDLDADLRGWVQVRTGRWRHQLMEIV